MLRHWQLLAAVLWGLLALGILLRDFLFEEERLARLPIRNWTIAAVISAVLAVWNVARWIQYRSMLREKRSQIPIQPRSATKGEYEYNPELDFQKMEREQSQVSNPSTDPPIDKNHPQ